MMWLIELKFTVHHRWYKEKPYTTLYHSLSLPFVPQTGLIIRNGALEATISKVVWDQSEGQFICKCEGDTGLSQEQNRHYGQQAHHVIKRIQSYRDTGWEYDKG